MDFTTDSGTAQQGSDFEPTTGTVTFEQGEQTKTISVTIFPDTQPEGDEDFFVNLSGTGANPIDNSTFFVRQHYLDFLGREPDASGLAFWVNGIESCGADAGCRDVKRIHTSAAFFLAIEFQETGFYVIRVQSAAFNRHSDIAGSRVGYTEFIHNARQVGEGVVMGQAGAAPRLDQNQTAYALRVVSDPEFIRTTPITMTAEDYVITLFQRANVFDPPSAEVPKAVDAFGIGDTAGRAAALRSVADSDSVRKQELNPAFVLMQYYGYLRRNPTDAPDTDDSGYQFWLSKLNSFNGDFVKAEMVRAFILSDEYRKRFGN